MPRHCYAADYILPPYTPLYFHIYCHFATLILQHAAAIVITPPLLLRHYVAPASTAIIDIDAADYLLRRHTLRYDTPLRCYAHATLMRFAFAMLRRAD